MTNPPSARPHPHPHPGGREPHVVRLGGFEWPSIAQAALALDYDHRTLARVLKKPKDSRAYQSLLRAVESYATGLGRKPCRES